jgi:hypothetical protein
MELVKIHQNFSSKEDFESFLKESKDKGRLNLNAVVDILGYIIATDKEEYVHILFDHIDDDHVKARLGEAVFKLGTISHKTKKTVKLFLESSSKIKADTGDKIMDLINGVDDGEDDVISKLVHGVGVNDNDSADEDAIIDKLVNGGSGSPKHKHDSGHVSSSDSEWSDSDNEYDYKVE